MAAPSTPRDRWSAAIGTVEVLEPWLTESAMDPGCWDDVADRAVELLSTPGDRPSPGDALRQALAEAFGGRHPESDDGLYRDRIDERIDAIVEHATGRDVLEAAALSAIVFASEDGCPVAPWRPETQALQARYAVRRWSRRRRWSKEPTHDERVDDLAKGIVERFDDRPERVGPLIGDYRFLAGCVGSALADVPPRRR